MEPNTAVLTASAAAIPVLMRLLQGLRRFFQD
jgi:hypothetical protein